MPFRLNTAHGFYPVICAPSKQSANAAHHKPLSCSCNALTAGHTTWQPRSCGHRSCPQCQNHETSLWLDRQQAKLLPVDYFMATFTLPYELRSLAWDNQTLIYNLLFACTSSTLKDFGLNPKNLGADIAMTAVLHTHNRRLDYHPHIHVVVPGGGVDKAKKQWKKKKSKYLFNEFAVAKVFHARFLEALTNAGLSLPNSVPKKWVVHCTHAGKGLSALKYLSRYLYRCVIGENNIVSKIKPSPTPGLIPPPIQKDICLYKDTDRIPQGSFNYRIRSWLASLSQSILIR